MNSDPNLDWATTRQDISRAYGEPPGPTLEAPIIQAFENNPQALLKMADEVAELYRNGNIHSPWPILRSRVERINEPLRNATVNKPNERAKAISRAEQWITNAGIHYDRETEVDAELFGDRGTLKEWADDQKLRARLLAAWNEQRPRGEQLEVEQAEETERWIKTHTCQRCGKMRPFLMAPCPHCRRVTTMLEVGERNVTKSDTNDHERIPFSALLETQPEEDEQ